MSTTLPITGVKKFAEEPPAEEGQDIPKKIAAEITFDKAVYGGISYAAQAGTGIVLSHWIKHGNGLQYYKDFAKALTGKTIDKVSTTAIITIMIMVGNSFVIPVKMLENRKAKIVRWINDKMNGWAESSGHPVSEEKKAEQEARLHYLEHHAPKQSWWSLGGGRAFGLGVVYGVDHLIGDKNNVLAQNFAASTIQSGLGTVGFKKLAESTTLRNYLRIGFIDAFYSAISAGGLYVYSHFINPPKHKPMAAKSFLESKEVVASPAPEIIELQPNANPILFQEQHPPRPKKQPAPPVSHTSKVEEPEPEFAPMI